MSIQRRIIIVMLFPITTLLWFLGWVLCWIGNRHRSRRTTQSLDDNLVQAVGLHEEAVLTSQN